MRPRPAELRGLAIAAAAAVAMHVAVLGEAEVAPLPPGAVRPVAPFVVRSVAAAPVAVEALAPAPETVAPLPAVVRPPAVRRRSVPHPPPPPQQTMVATPSSAPLVDVAAAEPDGEERVAIAATPLQAGADAGSTPVVMLAVSEEASAPSPVGAGAAMRDLGVPPPVYRVALPPPVTLHYEVRRGLLHGSGELRWAPEGRHYTLQLEARIGTLVLLVQSSTGSIGAHGLEPKRYVDRRLRRSAQAANLDAGAGRVTFSGPSTTYPLYPGTQDRLSIFVQLAGIAAADPRALVDGARFAMVVVGSRGDAAVWNLRVAGREAIETAAGTVQAIKVVRDARSPADTVAEIWLDPERHYLPAYATLRSASGVSEYDLLLQGMSSAPP